MCQLMKILDQSRSMQSVKVVKYTGNTSYTNGASYIMQFEEQREHNIPKLEKQNFVIK